MFEKNKTFTFRKRFFSTLSERRTLRSKMPFKATISIANCNLSLVPVQYLVLTQGVSAPLDMMLALWSETRPGLHLTGQTEEIPCVSDGLGRRRPNPAYNQNIVNNVEYKNLSYQKIYRLYFIKSYRRFLISFRMTDTCSLSLLTCSRQSQHVWDILLVETDNIRYLKKGNRTKIFWQCNW